MSFLDRLSDAVDPGNILRGRKAQQLLVLPLARTC